MAVGMERWPRAKESMVPCEAEQARTRTLPWGPQEESALPTA